MWVNQEEGGGVDFEFYRKPLSNVLVIMSNSAMPQSMKRIALTAEGLRRLLKTKKELGSEIQNGHLNE